MSRIISTKDDQSDDDLDSLDIQSQAGKNRRKEQEEENKHHYRQTLIKLLATLIKCLLIWGIVCYAITVMIVLLHALCPIKWWWLNAESQKIIWIQLERITMPIVTYFFGVISKYFVDDK